jgi:hypothetical protein
MLDGRQAAVYRIELDGRAAGEVRIRSAGAFRTMYEGRERTLIALEAEIDNRGRWPLTLNIDGLALAADIDSPLYATAASSLTVGETTAAPYRYRYVRYFVPLPGNISPQAVDRFAVRWHVYAAGHVFVERTDFVEDLGEEVRAAWLWPR